jgi:hypothetical protein
MPKRTVCLSLALTLVACGAPSQTQDSGVDPRDTGVTPTEDSAVALDAAATDSGVAPTEDALTPPTDATPPPSDSAVAPAADYTGNGPLTPSMSGSIALTLPASTGCSAMDCRVNAVVTAPTGSAEGRAAPFPVVVISNGFRLPASQYQSYALRLARWGYVVIRWDTTTEDGFIPRSISHRVLGNMLRALPDELARMPGMAATMDTRRVVFAGHSRGGKLSALAASGNANAVAFMGLDPVDAPPPMTPPGPEYPSGAMALASFRGPSVIVGAALGGVAAPGSFNMPCAPTAANFHTFFTGASAPSTEVSLAQTGHMQFVDDRARCPSSPLGGTICSLCTSGTATDASVRDLSQVLLVALSERATRGVDASAYLTAGGAWLSRQAGATVMVK